MRPPLPLEDMQLWKTWDILLYKILTVHSPLDFCCYDYLTIGRTCLKNAMIILKNRHTSIVAVNNVVELICLFPGLT